MAMYRVIQYCAATLTNYHVAIYQTYEEAKTAAIEIHEETIEEEYDIWRTFVYETDFGYTQSEEVELFEVER